MDDETARAQSRRIVNLSTADALVLGWQHVVLVELDQMRAEMLYADTLELRLSCERRPPD